MTTYTANFHNDAVHGFHAIEAETPAQARQLARQLWDDNPDEMEWYSYDERQALTDIVIQDEDDAVVAEWKDPDELVRLAAPEMLEALELCVDVLSDLARLDDSTPSISALHAAPARPVQLGGIGGPLSCRPDALVQSVQRALRRHGNRRPIAHAKHVVAVWRCERVFTAAVCV